MSNPIKVLIACDTFAPDINGAARFAERLAGGLVRNGNEVHIIAPSNEDWHGTRIETHDEAQMVVHRLKSHRLRNHKTLRWPTPFGMTRTIRNIVKDVNPDALHIQSHLMVGRFALRAAKGFKVRKIATNHIMPENLLRYSLLPKFLHPLAMKIIWADAGRILKHMDALTTPTRRAADLLERAAKLEGVLAISCGIDASRFANNTPTQNEKPVALFLGRLDDEKRLNILLDAIARLDSHPDLRLQLVGDGGERERLTKQAATLGISDRVEFLGHITDQELPGVYENCTVFVMPSIAELQSIATMEAMASGRPVVAANAMALPHLVHNGDNGYLFEPDDVDDFSNALLKIATANQKELDRLSENSLHLIQSHDIKRTLAIFEGLYRSEEGSKRETDDNMPEYMKPIGRLSVAVRRAELRMRKQTLLALGKISDLGDDIKDGLEELRDDVKRQAKKVDKQVRKGVKKTVTRAKKVIKRNEE